MIHVTLNGDRYPLPEGLSVRMALQHLGISPVRIAIEINRRIISKSEWDAVVLQDQDVIELVQFVGGGCTH
jgi:sulfur carrier protein